MNIGTILNEKGREVVRVTPEATLADVVACLNGRRIGAVLVIESGASRNSPEASAIRGIVSERDIIRALSSEAPAGDVLQMTAAQIMTAAQYTISPNADVAEAALLMTERRVRHLPVVENDRLIGMVSIGDVVKARIDQQTQEVDSLKAYVGGVH